MSYFPNRNRRILPLRAIPGYPGWPPLDTLYDYTAILSTTTPIGSIGSTPQNPVVIIGAGPAGMVAGYELLRTGIQPVILEASDRIGGRNFTDVFTSATSDAIGEMGAMRVPVSAKAFYYYANQFGINVGTFPDPGHVPTTLYYENVASQWNFGGGPYPTPTSPPAPGMFAQIETDWADFITPFINALDDAWPNMEKVHNLWQEYIDTYGRMSFYEALVQGIPGWGPAEFAAFGALGIGSGGFGPLFDIGFLEMLRVVLNQWETDQQLILGLPGQNVFGIHALTESLYAAEVNGESLQSIGAVQFNMTVTSILPNNDGTQQITYRDSNGNYQSLNSSAVIVATTTRSMQIMGLTLPSPRSVPEPIAQDVKAGLRTLHMTSSSKMFVRTPTKFWLDDPAISWNMQTDELFRGLYTLDYPWTDEGVILISYTWADDSDKLLALGKMERFKKFWEVINQIDPLFASYIDPQNVLPDDVLCIDWQATPNYYGAFKLNLPGQEPFLHAAYYQFLSVLDPNVNTGVYLAGDGVSWAGGWTEGALETGLNAACSVLQHIGGSVVANSPLTQDPNLYNYNG